MSANRYSCIWPQAGHVIFPFCSAASLTNIEKTLPQILQESSTLISLIVPLRRFGLSEMLQGDRLLNRAGNREKALLAFDPTRRIVPTTNTKITASITAYSAISWPVSSVQNLGARSVMGIPFKTKNHLAQQTAATCKRWPGAMFDTPANASSVILTFLRFAARVSGETRSCVSRLRVPSVRGGQ